jgi:hypothetical protein
MWYVEIAAPITASGSAVFHTSASRRRSATPSTITSGYMAMR